MKTLILARHANAESGIKYNSDFDRKLSAWGKTDASAVSKYFIDHFAKPEKFISSNAERAMETSKIFCENFKFDTSNIVYSEELYSNNPNSILYLINETHDMISRLMILGHNPSISQVVCYFLRTVPFIVPSSSIISIHFDCSSWEGIYKAESMIDCYLTPDKILNKE